MRGATLLALTLCGCHLFPDITDPDGDGVPLVDPTQRTCGIGAPCSLLGAACYSCDDPTRQVAVCDGLVCAEYGCATDADCRRHGPYCDTYLRCDGSTRSCEPPPGACPSPF
jgi:hypothetical protein